MEPEDGESLKMTREESEAALASGDTKLICGALDRCALHDGDWVWVQEQCMRFARHESPDVRRAAARGLGTVCRIRRELDVDAAMDILEDLYKDPEAKEAANEAMDDIEQFFGKPHAPQRRPPPQR